MGVMEGIDRANGGAAQQPDINAEGAVLTRQGQPTTSLKPARVPRTAHLALGQLPGSNAFTTQTAYAVPDGVRAITFYVTYTRGASGGRPKFRALTGNGIDEGAAVIVNSVVTTSEPVAQQDMRGGEYLGPSPADANPVSFNATVKLEGGETTIRLLAAEQSALTPGQCLITLTAAYG